MSDLDSDYDQLSMDMDNTNLEFQSVEYYHKAAKMQVLTNQELISASIFNLPKIPKATVSMDIISQYPTKSCSAFNRGDIETVKKLVNSCFNDNCLWRLIKPNYTTEKVGSSNIVELLSTLHDNFPDGINHIHSVKYCRKNNGARLFKVKYSFFGTQLPQINSKAIETQTNQFTIDENVADGMDKSMLTSQNIQTIQQIENNIKSSGHLLSIQSAMILRLYVDQFTGKIGLYEVQCKTVSFDTQVLTN